jgi:tetratricopeptide (TPR) repeat protein
LAIEEEGLEKTREQHGSTESKTRLVEQIKIYLHSSDYSRALDLLRGTAAEFPNDAEFSALETLAQEGLNRKSEADRLISESQELFAQQKPSQAIQWLRKAYELDRNHSLARSILANALVEHAYSIVETDWWESETLVNEALNLNPAHPTARTIHSRILDQKTAGSVEEWVSQTRKLQSSGNLSAALSQIAEAFAVYPRHPRLLQLQDAIQRDHSVQRRQARRRDLENLRSMRSEVEAAADVASKKTLRDRIQYATAKYSTDGEFLSVANEFLRRLGLLDVTQKSSTVSETEEATLPDSAPSLAAPEAALPDTVVASPRPMTPRSIQPSIERSSVAVSSKATLGLAPLEKVPTIPPRPQLPPQPAPVPEMGASAAASKTESPPSRIKPRTRFNSASVILVSAAAIILAAAIFFFARNHTVPAVAKIPEAAPALPSVSTPAVSASAAGLQVMPAPAGPLHNLSAVDPNPTPSLPGRFSDSSPGIETGHSNESSPDVASSRTIPSDHDEGAILVVAGEDSARVLLNGKLQPQVTQAGQLLLRNLELKVYTVQVSKNGFQDPPQQTIRVRGGEQSKLVFNLQPLPQLASLTIQGGMPGTKVLLDQGSIGTVQPDGTLSASNLSPGDHILELRKEGFKPRQFEKHFVASGTTSLAAADAVLEAALSELKISYAPADARVAIVKAGELPTIVSSGVPVKVSAGTYTLTARTAESITRFSTFEMIAGESKTFDLSLAPSGMSKWDNPGSWKHEGDSDICKGGDFVLYGVPASGTFVFSAMPARGRSLQWVLNYTDPKNYVLFQMDDNFFHRTVIRNGEKTDEIMVPDKADKKSFRTLHIRVGPTEIVHQIKEGESWKILDRWSQPGVNLSLGKFGFYIPGNDEVALSSFGHYADLTIR